MELRKIMFALPEVQLACSTFCRTQGVAIVDGDISHLTISEDPRETVAIHLKRGGDQGGPARLALRREDVAEALIQYCIRQKVPLPRAGKKVLWPQEDGISLMVTVVAGGEREKTEEREKDAFAGAASLQRLIRRDR